MNLPRNRTGANIHQKGSLLIHWVAEYAVIVFTACPCSRSQHNGAEILGLIGKPTHVGTSRIWAVGQPSLVPPRTSRIFSVRAHNDRVAITTPSLGRQSAVTLLSDFSRTPDVTPEILSPPSSSFRKHSLKLQDFFTARIDAVKVLSASTVRCGEATGC